MAFAYQATLNLFDDSDSFKKQVRKQNCQLMDQGFDDRRPALRIGMMSVAVEGWSGHVIALRSLELTL